MNHIINTCEGCSRLTELHHYRREDAYLCEQCLEYACEADDIEDDGSADQ